MSRTNALMKFVAIRGGYWEAERAGMVFRVEPAEYVSKADRHAFVAVVRRGRTEIKRVAGFGSATAARKWLETQAMENGA